MFNFENKIKAEPASSKEKLEKTEKEIFVGHLKEIVGKLDESGLDWRIVGGLAIDSLSNKETSIRRINGTLRDIDVMSLNNLPKEQLASLNNYFKGREKIENQKGKAAAVYPEVSLGGVAKTEDYSKDSKKIIKIPQLMPHLLLKSEGTFLKFRDIEEKLDPRILEKFDTKIRIGGQEVDIKTFPPQTILHLYLQRTGYIKPKDMDKIKVFARQIKKNYRDDNKSFPHELYLPFHKFTKRMREKYKILTRAWECYTFIDDKYFNSSLSHKLIPQELLDFLLKA